MPQHSDVAIAYHRLGRCRGGDAGAGLAAAAAQGSEDEDTSSVEIGAEPEVALALTMRSGPVVIEVEYDVDPDKAREFYGVMMQLAKVRKRIGAFDWSISRDIANPAIWIERYHCPTWGDYLRMRDRYTQADLDIQEQADSFNRTRRGQAGAAAAGAALWLGALESGFARSLSRDGGLHRAVTRDRCPNATLGRDTALIPKTALKLPEHCCL